MLRIYADWNSATDDGWCWCLRYEERSLDELASGLGLTDGMRVVLFYSDVAEEFEFDGVLRSCHTSTGTRWEARADESSFRRIR